MKKYNVINKKNGQLLLSFITYDKKIGDEMLKQFKKLKRILDIVEAK